MINYTKSRTDLQVQSIVDRHTAEIRAYSGDSGAHNTPRSRVTLWLEQLSDICLASPEQASDQLFTQASDLLARVDTFLEMMNQQPDDRFLQTEVGRIWQRATKWCEAGRTLRAAVTRNDVWERLAPAIPDTLDQVGENLFEAKWAAPVPVMDVEVLQRTEGVRICGDAFEPRDMPAGIGFRFTVRP